MGQRHPIVARFEERLESEPDRTLLLSPRRAMTFDALDRMAREIEPLFSTYRERAVLLDPPNGPDLVATMLALWRAGAVPLLLDHGTPESARNRIAEQFGVGARVVIGDFGDRVTLERYPESWGRWRPEQEQSAAIKLTSGSAGQPRGVEVSAAQLAADGDQLFNSFGLRAADRALAAIPLTHSYGLGALLVPALTHGLRLIFPDDSAPLAALVAAARAEATVFPTVPAFLAALVRLAEPPAWPASIRLVISAGAPLEPEVARRFRQRFGLPVQVLYGASECGGISFDRRGDAAERGSVGTAVDGVTITLDAEQRIVVSSPAVFGDGSFTTADRGEFVAGELRLLGRVDEVINIKGKKVDPRVVERAIRALPGVREVAVLGVERVGRFQLRAVVAGDDLDFAAIDAHCRQQLADHERPRSIVIVDALPRTARGKLDREALRA